MIDVVTSTVPAPDGAAAAAVRARLGGTGSGGSAYGRLGQLAALLAGAGVTVPSRIVLLRPNGDGTASTLADGLAERAGVAVRELELPPAVEAAFAAGRDAVDSQIDAGADLLLVAAPGRRAGTAARAVVSALTSTEPVHLLPWPSAGADEQWMIDLVAIRDLRRRAAAHSAEPTELLAAIGDPSLALIAGVLVQAAVRRTLAVIDGVAVGGAALAAHRLAPAALSWWVAADRSLDPSADLVAGQLGLHCVLDLDLRVADGTAALLAAELLDSAARIAAATDR